MTRPTWTGLEDIPGGPPKDFDELTADFMQHHFPLLWCVMEAYEKEQRKILLMGQRQGHNPR